MFRVVWFRPEVHELMGKRHVNATRIQQETKLTQLGGYLERVLTLRSMQYVGAALGSFKQTQTKTNCQRYLTGETSGRAWARYNTTHPLADICRQNNDETYQQVVENITRGWWRLRGWVVVGERGSIIPRRLPLDSKNNSNLSIADGQTFPRSGK